MVCQALLLLGGCEEACDRMSAKLHLHCFLLAYALVNGRRRENMQILKEAEQN